MDRLRYLPEEEEEEVFRVQLSPESISRRADSWLRQGPNPQVLLEEGRRLLRLDKGSHSRDPPQMGAFLCSVASALRDVAPASHAGNLLLS